MTYGVQRMTFTGNTLCDRLKAEFGERTAVAINRSRNEEAARRRDRRGTFPAAGRSRTVGQAMSAARTERSRAQALPRHPEAYRDSRPLRRPGTDAYRSAQAQRAQAARRSTANAAGRPHNLMRDTVVHRMPKPDTGKTALQSSVEVFGRAYARGERIRERAAAERNAPRRRSAPRVSTKKTVSVTKILENVRTFFLGAKPKHVEVKQKKAPFPLGMVALLAVCTMMVMVMMNSFAQLYEYRREISDLRTKQEQLDAEAVRLNGLLEARDDIRTVEQIATEKIGMVSSDLVESRFVSLADSDRVELKDTGDSENTGAFSTLLSAIGENLGKISEYFN